MKQQPAEVLRQYRSGVEAVHEVSASFDEGDWSTSVCGKWTAVETVRHLLGVVGWYDEWLDRALAGESTVPFRPDEFDVRNDRLIVEHAGLSGPAAVDLFVERALAYGGRVVEHWDVPYGFPLGSVTAGLHLGVAAAEWHLHAWDLSCLSDARHGPADSAGLFVGAGLAMAEASGGFRGGLLRRLVPLGARFRPWPTILKESGRTS